MKEILNKGKNKDKEPKFFKMVTNFRANLIMMLKMGLEFTHGKMVSNTEEIWIIMKDRVLVSVIILMGPYIKDIGKMTWEMGKAA